MKIILLGANGQLGSEIVRHSLLKNYELIALTREHVDFVDAQSVINMIAQYQPQIIINAAAYTAVDKAESEQEKAFLINSETVSVIAKHCSAMNIPLIHISTDYVFDGKKNTPYLEDDMTKPINIYGLSKLKGEELIRANWYKHIILRVSWLYGFYGNNFVKTILRLAKEREELKIVNDQWGCPTSAKELAKVIYEIISLINQNNFAWGTYHYCNGPQTSWYQFAERIVAVAKKYDDFKVKNILPIETVNYPTPASRPNNSVLNCDKLAIALKMKPRSWQDILPEVIAEIYQ